MKISIKEFILIWLFLWLFALIILPSVYAEVNHETTTLTAPDNYTITYNDTGTNETHLFPLACLVNETLGPIQNKCEIERTLSHGETFDKEDNYCDVRFTSPVCDIPELKDNITYNIRWRVEAQDDNFQITYLNEGFNKTFSRGGNFELETEFEIACPDVGERGYDDGFDDPFNITDSQFLNYCLKPFGNYGRQLTDLNTFYTKAISTKDSKLTDLSASNMNLASDLASCEEFSNTIHAANTQRDEMKQEHMEMENSLNNCNEESLTLNKEASGKTLWVVLFFGLLIANFIIIGEYRLRQSMKEGMGGGGF